MTLGQGGVAVCVLPGGRQRNIDSEAVKYIDQEGSAEEADTGQYSQYKEEPAPKRGAASVVGI